MKLSRKEEVGPRELTAMPQPTDTADHIEPIDTGFVAFCYAERTETHLNLLGQAVIDLIMSGVDRSNIQKPFRTREMAGVSLLPIAVCAPPLLPAGLVASMAPLPPTVMACWLLTPFVNSVWTRYQTPGEATCSELASCASDAGQRRYVRALEEYREWLSQTPDQLFIRSSNGGLRPITKEEYRAIQADHGRQLLLSSDRSGWPKVRGRPLPGGKLMVCLRGRRAKSLLTSMRLMLEQDDEVFGARVKWLSQQAQGLNKGRLALTNGLELLPKLRKARLEGMSLTAVLNDAAEHGIGHKESMIQKLWSGNYVEFEEALERLPLETMP